MIVKKNFLQKVASNAIFWKQIILLFELQMKFYKIEVMEAWFHAKVGEELAAKCYTSQNLAPILKYV